MCGIKMTEKLKSPLLWLSTLEETGKRWRGQSRSGQSVTWCRARPTREKPHWGSEEKAGGLCEWCLCRRAAWQPVRRPRESVSACEGTRRTGRLCRSGDSCGVCCWSGSSGACAVPICWGNPCRSCRRRAASAWDAAFRAPAGLQAVQTPRGRFYRCASPATRFWQRTG